MKKSAVGLLAAGTIVSVGLLFSACGGGSTPGVASLGTTTTTTTTTTAGASGTGGSGNKQQDALEYSKCMRSHSVTNFPDPTKTTGGGIQIGSGTGINPTSPQFKAATKACQSLLPKPSTAQVKQHQEDALEFTKCMRSHGVPNFPDPQFTGGGISLKITSKSGVDPNSPTFQAAQEACGKYMHFPKGAPPKSSSTSGSRGVVGG